MMKRATDLIGKSIVSADNGQKVGNVADLLLDDDAHRLVGLIVKQGLLRSEHILPAEAVQTFGRDTVVCRSASDLIEGREWRRRHSVPAEEGPDQTT